MLITLKNISHENKVSRSGKPYVSCKLTVAGKDGGKDVWISGFGSEITKTWQAGDVVEVNLQQTDKGYWNFEENKDTKASPNKVLILLNEINDKLDKLLGGSEAHQAARAAGFVTDKEPKNEVTSDQINF